MWTSVSPPLRLLCASVILQTYAPNPCCNDMLLMTECLGQC